MRRTHNGPWILPLAAVSLSLFLAAGTAAAQNLVTNGSFDHDISGWITPLPEIIVPSFRSDAGNDLPGGSGPGSLEPNLSDSVLRGRSGALFEDWQGNS